MITGNGLQALSSCTSLQKLSLECCLKITDSDLQTISKLTALQNLNLRKCHTLDDSDLLGEYLKKVAKAKNSKIEYFL